MKVTIFTGVHPGGLDIWWGAPRCQKERKSDWGAGKTSIVLQGCCCTAVLLYCCTAVLLYCCTAGVLGWLLLGYWGEFQWDGIDFFENSIGV